MKIVRLRGGRWSWSFPSVASGGGGGGGRKGGVAAGIKLDSVLEDFPNPLASGLTLGSGQVLLCLPSPHSTFFAPPLDSCPK